MAHAPGSTLKPLVRLPKDANDCWPWISTVSPNGHAMKTVDGKSLPAARWMWAQLFGPVPKGMVIFHACGNQTCINPHHLRCGSQAEACRSGPGSTERPIVLTPADVRALRSILPEERTAQRARVLADQLGCSVGTVRGVWRGSAWRRPRPHYGPRKRAA